MFTALLLLKTLIEDSENEKLLFYIKNNKEK
jgi:hypothetical protein